MIGYDYYGPNSYRPTSLEEPYDRDLVVPEVWDDGVNGQHPIIFGWTSPFRDKGLTSIKLPIHSNSFYTPGNMFLDNELKIVEFYNDTLSLDTVGPINPSMFNGVNNKIEKLILNLNLILPIRNSTGFNAVTSSNPMTVYVPANLIESYKSAQYWDTMFNDGRVIFKDISSLQPFKQIGALYLDTTKLGDFTELRLTKEETIQLLSDGELETEAGVIYASNKLSDPATELQTQNGVITPDELIDIVSEVPNRIENDENTQFIDTQANDVAVDLRPSLSQGGGSESGRIKFARNFFELYAEKMGLGSKYIYHLTTKDNGSIEIVVGDTNSELGQETYSFDFTSRENTNQVARVKELQDAVDTIADLLGVL